MVNDNKTTGAECSDTSANCGNSASDPVLAVYTVKQPDVTVAVTLKGGALNFNFRLEIHSRLKQ